MGFGQSDNSIRSHEEVELFSRNLQLDYNGPIGTTHFSPSEDDDMRGERVSRMKSGESYPKQSPGPS